MQTVFIKFTTEGNRVRGFYELATRARVASWPDDVYQVPLEALRILDDQHISFRRATDGDVKSVHNQVRNPTPAVYYRLPRRVGNFPVTITSPRRAGDSLSNVFHAIRLPCLDRTPYHLYTYGLPMASSG
jgi:hypothetical protein